MKHFHITDEKKRLAHEIFSETQLLHEQETDRSNLVMKLTYKETSFKEAQEISAKLLALKKSIKNREEKIKELQAKHDAQ